MKKQTKSKNKEKSQEIAPSEPAQVIDLDEEAVAVGEEIPVELVEPAHQGLGMRLHAVNVRFPWLKVALLVLLAGSVAFGVEELLRHNVSQPIGRTTEVNVETNEPEEQTPVQPEENNAGVSEEKPAEETPEVDEKPEVEPPAPEQPTTPVTPTVPQPSTGRKLVALTFDDGPSAAQTPRLLQILRDKNVKATFFVVGNMAQRSPDILRQEEAEGHEVASHTMTHANLNKSTVEGIKWETAAINGVFTDILGHGPSLTRPPYGNINNNVRTYVNQPLILWAVDPEDWRYRDAAIVRRNVVNNTFDGAIVLMHDIHATTVDAVAGIIDDLRAAGYEFMTVSELAAARGVVMQNGAAYGSFRP